MPLTSTVQDVYDGALARNKMNDGTQLVGTAEVIGFVSRKQQEKFLLVSKMNAEFFGNYEEISLQSGTYAAVLSTIDPAIAAIDLVTITDKGTSSYTNGDEVNIVGVRDFDAELAPRMFLQRYQLTPVGTDMNGVTKVTIYYSVLPATMDNTVTDMSTLSLDMPDEHIDTLITELALHMAIKDNRSADELALLEKESKDADAILVATAQGFTRKWRRFNE